MWIGTVKDMPDSDYSVNRGQKERHVHVKVWFIFIEFV